MACNVNMVFVILPLLLLSLAEAQNYEYRGNGGSGSSTLFMDPIRRALGLWGRLLDRMSQPGPPTDEQLRLRGANAEDGAFPTAQDRFFAKTNPAAAGDGDSIFRGPGFAGLENLFRNDARNAATSGSSGGGRSIIDERRLLELLPRMREPDTTTTTTTTTEPTTTTTTTEPTTITTTTTTTSTTTTTTPTTITTTTTTRPAVRRSKVPKNSVKARMSSLAARRKAQQRHRKAKALQKARAALGVTAVPTNATTTTMTTTVVTLPNKSKIDSKSVKSSNNNAVTKSIDNSNKNTADKNEQKVHSVDDSKRGNEKKAKIMDKAKDEAELKKKNEITLQTEKGSENVKSLNIEKKAEKTQDDKKSEDNVVKVSVKMPDENVNKIGEDQQTKTHQDQGSTGTNDDSKRSKSKSASESDKLRKETEVLISEIENVLGDEHWLVNGNASLENQKQQPTTPVPASTNKETGRKFSGQSPTKSPAMEIIEENKIKDENNSEIGENATTDEEPNELENNALNESEEDDSENMSEASGEEPIDETIDSDISSTPSTETTSQTETTTIPILATSANSTAETTTKAQKVLKKSGEQPKLEKNAKSGKKDDTVDEYEYEEEGEEGGEEIEEYPDYRVLKFQDSNGNDTNATVAAVANGKKRRKHRRSKKARIGIPEAEPEEEDKSASKILGNLTLSQLDTASMSAAVAGGSSSGSASSALALNPSFANAIDPAAVIVPVRYANSIIDGIGPLILPLLGYSGQQAASLVRARAAAAPTYQGDNTIRASSAYGSNVQRTQSNIRDYTSQSATGPSASVRYAQQRQYAAPTYGNEIISPAGSDGDGARGDVLLKARRPNSPVNSADVRMSAQELESTHLRQMQNAPEWAPAHMASLRNRVVNAETDIKADDAIHGLKARFMPNPASITRITQPTPTVFASDAIRRALSNILQQPRITTPTTQEMAEVAMRQIYDPAADPRYQNINVYRESDASSSRSSQMKSVASEPGTELGRQNVENNFYEDSGVMVNADSAPTLPSASLASGASGFGGGRRPSVPLDDAAPVFRTA